MDETNKTDKIYEETEEIKFYHGYEVHKNGTIKAPTGRTVQPYAFSYPYSHVTLKIDGKEIKKNKAILIYNMFSPVPFNIHNDVIQFRDGDTNNAAFANLYTITRKELLNRFDHGKSKFTDEEKLQIFKEYEENDISMRKIAWKYDCSLRTIQKIIGTYRKQQDLQSNDAKEGNFYE